jgi:hypothetical protein
MKTERSIELMANNKLDRIDAEIAKTREKISEQQARLKELLTQKTELENLQIVQLVRSMRLTPAQLTAMLSGGGIPGMNAVPEEMSETEDTDHEEE